MSLCQAHISQCSDEADVFLESRGKGAANSTERNALVSGKVNPNVVHRVMRFAHRGSVPSCT